MSESNPLAEIARAEITRILTQLRNGDDRAAERLLPLVYDRLRDIARNQFRNERRNHTLQPTALVHQAYLEMVEHKFGRETVDHLRQMTAHKLVRKHAGQ